MCQHKGYIATKSKHGRHRIAGFKAHLSSVTISNTFPRSDRAVVNGAKEALSQGLRCALSCLQQATSKQRAATLLWSRSLKIVTDHSGRDGCEYRIAAKEAKSVACQEDSRPPTGELKMSQLTIQQKA